MTVACISANTAWYLHNFRRETIKMIQAKGYRVVCVCPRDSYSKRLEGELGVETVDVKMDGGGTNPLRDLATLGQFVNIYRRTRPRFVMHFTIKNNVYGSLAAAALRIPTINNVSGLGTAFIHPGWVGWIVRMLYRASFPKAFRVFCQNVDDLELLVSLRLVPRPRLALIPGSGVDLQRFRPAQEAAPTGRPFRFLYSGRMLADKGLCELVEAFRQLREVRPNSELWLLGFVDAANRSAIPSEMIHEWRQTPGIVFMGESDCVEDVLRQVDCAVLPSYREGLPRSLLEAAATALPLIATDVPGCRSVVRDGVNGFLCKPRDAISLKDAMDSMMTLPPGARQAMGRSGRELVEAEYGVQRVVDAYRDAIESIEHAAIQRSRSGA